MLYTKEDKMRVIRLYLDEGKIEYPPNADTHQKQNIRKRIKKWVGVYKEKGEDGLEPKKKQFTYEDKKFAIERLLAGESKYQIAFKMGMCDTKRLRIWEKRYKEMGWAGLKYDGNKAKYFNVKVTAATKLKEAEKEVEYLRQKVKEQDIEIEYLKKLNALVLKRKGQQN